MLVLEVLNKWIDFQQICVIKQTVCVCLCLDHLRFPWFRRKSLCASPIKQERLTSSVSSGWREETLFTLIQNISTKTKLLSMKITIGSLLIKMLKDSSGNKQKLRSIYQNINHKTPIGLEIFFGNLINLSFHITSLKEILHIFTWPGHFKNPSNSLHLEGKICSIATQLNDTWLLHVVPNQTPRRCGVWRCLFSGGVFGLTLRDRGIYMPVGAWGQKSNGIDFLASNISGA